MTAAARMPWLIGGLTATCALGGGLWRGWPWSAAFLLGAAASCVIYFALHKAVEAIDPGHPPERSMRGRIVLVGLRYVLLAGGAYAILRFSTLPVSGALAGLFVPAAAAVLEILVEIIYGSS